MFGLKKTKRYPTRSEVLKVMEKADKDFLERGGSFTRDRKPRKKTKYPTKYYPF